MPQDAYTLLYLCKELNSVFANGKVNRIVQPDNDRVIFTVFTGKKTEKLLISVNPASPRIGIIGVDEESPLTAPNFCMLLRKHLLSATINKISLVGFDRIVKIDFTTCAEICDSQNISLYVELMGRYSNIILTLDGLVLGGNRGINNFDNGIRPLIVGRKYVFPPTNGKLLPNDEKLIEIFRKEDNLGVDSVFNNVQGLAKSTIEDITFNFDFKSENACENLYQKINEYIEKPTQKPCVITENGEIVDFCVSPYKSIKGEAVFFEKIYIAEDKYFSERQKKKDLLSKKSKLLSVVSGSIKKAKKRLSYILSKEKDALDCENNRIKGELIVSNIYKIKYGDSSCVVDNYYDGSKMEITLDKRLSPSDNAQAYFKKYNKQKRTLLSLTPQKEQTLDEIKYLESVVDEIDLAESVLDIISVREELEQEKLIPIQNTKKKKADNSICREYDYLGFLIKVGRNNCENDAITFSAKKEDIWLHVKDYHSSHAIICCEGKEITDKVITFASEVVAYYSKARDGGKVEVVYTQRKNVKKPSKSKMGFVTYSNFKSVFVLPDAHLKNTKNA